MAWLHVATVPDGGEGMLFSLLDQLGFRPLGWADEHDSLAGTYGREAPLDEAEHTIAALADLGVAFAVQHMAGWTYDGGWQDGWRVVHVPGVGTASGVADSEGRFVVDAEQVRLALRAAGGDFATMASRLNDLLGYDVVDAFDRLWRAVEH
jgi:hypothetical protein